MPEIRTRKWRENSK